MPTQKITIEPVTAERWLDLESLFGERGACAGCWCMWWRLRRKEWNEMKGDGNKKALRKIVKSNSLPGLIAYVNGVPAGWCAVRPRDEFPVLNNSRILKPVDDEPVWSIVCLFVLAAYRKQGLSVKLIEAAVKHVKKQGGKIVEGYPTETAKLQPAAFVYTGLASAFVSAGFEEVARRSKSRPIMRYILTKKSAGKSQSSPKSKTNLA
jgi:GNAT superfamily N-acetyltransferase